MERKTGKRLNMIFVFLIAFFFLSIAAYTYAIATSEETLYKAAKYDFYMEKIEAYENMTKACITTPIILC